MIQKIKAKRRLYTYKSHNNNDKRVNKCFIPWDSPHQQLNNNNNKSESKQASENNEPQDEQKNLKKTDLPIMLELMRWPPYPRNSRSGFKRQY